MKIFVAKRTISILVSMKYLRVYINLLKDEDNNNCDIIYQNALFICL